MRSRHALPISETALVQQPKDPDRYEQFAELMQQHHDRVYGYIHTLVRDFSATEDLLQETFLTVWRKFDDFQPGTNFGTWACEIARYQVLNFLKKERRRTQRFSDAFEENLAIAVEETDFAEDDLRREALQHCVGNLSDSQRELLWEYYGGKTTVAELAEKRGRSSDGVYGSLRHIRNKLHECVTRYLAREPSQ